MQGNHNTERGLKKSTVPMLENKSSKSEKGGEGKEGTKQRLNFGILGTVLNGNFVFHLHGILREHKPGIRQEDLISVSQVLYGNGT
jgi:hypothetical protein